MHWTQGFLVGLLFSLLTPYGQVGCASGLNEYSDDTSYEVVFPEKISNEKRTKRSMDSQLDEDEEHLKYRIKGFGKDLVLDLHKNVVTVTEDLLVRTFDEQGKEIVERSLVKNCQYQGHIQGDPESIIVLDTCDGLRGMIEDAEQELLIEPLKSKGVNAHKLSRIKKPEKINCGVEGHNRKGLYHNNERSRRSLKIHRLFRPHMKKVVDKTRYTEVIIVIDNHIYKKYNSDKKDMTRRVLTLINAVDMIYQKINIRIILKRLDIWSNKDLVPYNDKAGVDLANFQKYKDQHPNHYKCDTVHLMRGVMWKDHGGMAYLAEMCKPKSTGVVGWNFWSLLGPWLALAHEMGHNFGFDHDADGHNCKCLTPRGCIMNTFKTRVPGFSDCNLRDLYNIDDSCLYNIPERVYNPRCGNGIKEKGEQCDCGTKANCAIVDPCCNPKTCKLRISASCSNLHDGCCQNCQIAPAGTVCRKTKGECDVPEKCDGQSSKCPSNDVKIDGAKCFYNDMVLTGNNQGSAIKITPLPRPITARYIRINPINWDKEICMRAEVYGCRATSRLSPNQATSIRSINNLCVEAKNGLCYKQDKSELFFVQSDCKSRNSQFKLLKDGALLHQCTGNRVCAANNKVSYGYKLVISKDCTQRKALKFKRDGKLLCLIKKPNICIHPHGGVPRDDVALTSWITNKKKNNDKLSLLFSKPDCLDPLGMIDNRIKNHQITASSNLKHKDPMHARLAGFNSWCAGVTNKKQYLQIDLGKVKRIGGIATEGTYDGKRVKKYRLFYSNDGKQWVEYTGNRLATKNSCCLKGVCAPTNTIQCQKRDYLMRKNALRLNCPKHYKHYGRVCAGNGICTSSGRCHCKDGFDPASNCVSAVQRVNGAWGTWTKWSKCTRVCDGGFKRRHRFCNNPAPRHGGQKCLGKRIQIMACKTPICPVANSCRHLQTIGKKTGIKYPSGVYKINPDQQGIVKTYCDMSRNGGGWTLLVTSHTNTWTPNNVRRRNTHNPRLDDDFSILYKADAIKKGSLGDFEYRIEAQEFGRWGGIWKAPFSYSFVATNNLQTNIELKKKFDNWFYENYGIEERMPWINGSMLTTSQTTDDKVSFGSITASIPRFYPAPWINNKDQEQHPTNIWYWMRENNKVASSCMQLQLLGIESNRPLSSGVHTLTVNGKMVKTYCDFTSEGGAWTLLLTSSSRTGWNKQTLAERNPGEPSLDKDFSILGISDSIIKNRLFQYKIEDGSSKWGGIFEAKPGQGLLSTRPQKQTRLLKKLTSNWDKTTSSLDDTVPYIKDTVLLYTTSTSGDSSGTLVSSSAVSGTFIPVKNEYPSVVRLWVREGTWRSCNEIVVKSGITKHQLEDGVYMIKRSPHKYLPVMCDMTSDPGAWTLLVTSARNGWRKNQVKFRNIKKPSLSRDYSILGLGDKIKSISRGKTFKYKLEANKKGRWGGVWSAPVEYSFVKTDNQQTNVKLIKKFGKWNYNKWDQAIEKRMPWLGKTKGLLTTSTHSNYYEYGSVISESTVNNPAMWIAPYMINPGRIWYWVNEDDCGSDRLPVNGDVSSWGSWSACSPMCSNNSIRTRQRTCTNPSPRCGGKNCDPALLASETQRCHYCPRSPIKGDNNLCIQPKTGNCNPPDGTKLSYTDNNGKCNKKHMYFLLGKDNILIHQCSGKKVCPSGGFGSDLQLHSSCQPAKSKFGQTPQKGLKHLESGLCVHPFQGVASEGVKLVTWSGCTNSPGSQKLKLDLFKLSKNAAVKVKAKSNVSPIRSKDGLCLQPMTANCSPSNGTAIIYHGTGGVNVQCDKNYMEFTFANGILKHTCSGMYLCPEPLLYDVGTTLWDGIRMVLIEKGCHPHQVSYRRKKSKALEYKTSGFCLQRESTKPNSKAMFSKDCTSPGTFLDFYKL